jgi:hypothetical protein
MNMTKLLNAAASGLFAATACVLIKLVVTILSCPDDTVPKQNRYVYVRLPDTVKHGFIRKCLASSDHTLYYKYFDGSSHTSKFYPYTDNRWCLQSLSARIWHDCLVNEDTHRILAVTRDSRCVRQIIIREIFPDVIATLIVDYIIPLPRFAQPSCKQTIEDWEMVDALVE